MKDKHTIVSHHVIPTSRGGTNDKTNLAYVMKETHKHYHQLFQNKTPDEIIEHLVHYFWNDQWGWLEAAKKRFNTAK